MKKVLLMGMLVMPAIIFAQEEYTIKGKIGNIQVPAKVFMQYESQGTRAIDSANVVNGEFKFHGVVQEPSQGYLILSKEGKSLRELTEPEVNVVYLSKGVITVEGASLADAKISGTSLNEEFTNYKVLSQEVNIQMEAVDKEFREASDELKRDAAFIEGLRGKASKAYELQNEINQQYITKNPKSFISLNLMGELLSGDNVKDFEKTFALMPTNYKSTVKGKQLGERIQALKKLATGEVAPDFTLPDTSGNPIALSSLRGKYVLVDFWASWCGPCRHENPYVVAAYNKFKDRGFTVFGVSLDNPGKKDAWVNAIDEDNLGQWHHVSDLKGWKSEVVALYSITGIPQNYLLDKEGRIVASNLRGEALVEKLAEVLK